MPRITTFTRLFVAVAIAAGLLATPGSALAADDVVFSGSGWGHGVGMSQYGARAMALEGKSAAEITGYYYQGTTVAPTADPGPLWIGLLQDRTSFDFMTSNGTLTDLCQDGDGEGPCPKSVHPAPGELWRFAVTGGQCQFYRIDGDVPVPQGNPGGCRAAIAWTQPGGLIDLPDLSSDRRPCWTKDLYPPIRSCFAHGELKIRPTGTGGFHVTLVVPTEKYLYGLDEVPSSWPVESLKAQALAGRGYAVARAVAYPVLGTDETRLRPVCACQLYATTKDQNYIGYAKETLATAWIGAVDATAGQVITYGGAVISAFYSSSSGGRTENVEDVWGGPPTPYLRSVEDHWSLVGNPNASWTATRNRDAVAAAVGITQLASIQVTARNVSGSARQVTFRGLDADRQWKTVVRSGDSVRSMFGLKSSYFNVDAAYPVIGPRPQGVGVHDPSTGVWSLRGSNGTVSAFYYGNPADIPYAGDWNGDGVYTLGLYRQSTGFLFLRNSNTQGIADVEIYYGDPGDVPLAGDWDGDGIDTVGIYRPSQARFYLRNSNTQGIADVTFEFGDLGDVPLVGDWNGDGIDTPAVYRPSNKRVYFANSQSPVVDFTFDYTGTSPGDRVMAGDWNGDGTDTLGIFRPSNATFFLRDTYQQSTANHTIPLGTSQLTPVAGFWGW